MSIAARLNEADIIPARPGGLPVEWGEEIEPQLSNLWRVKGVLPLIGIALTYGHPGSGKSFFALDIAMHVALGWNWNGRITRQGLVVYVGAEGQQGLRNRIVAFRSHHGIQGRLPFALVPCPIDLQDPKADVRRLADVVRAAAARYGVEVAMIIVDTISKTFGSGKENTDDMASYVANCGWLSSEFLCCVMPIHHRPKDAESTDPRGHSSLKGGMDTVILIEAGKTKRARITKQKDGEDGEQFLFNLRAIELGQDEDGDPVTSCIVEMTDVDSSPTIDPFARAVAKLSTGNRLIYDQLGEVISASGFAPPPSIPATEIHRIRVGKVALLDDWRDKSISAAGTEAGHNRDTGKRAFNRALNALKIAGVVRVWNEWAWITYALPDHAGTAPGQPAGQERDAGTSGTRVFRPCPSVPPRESAPGGVDDEHVPGWDS